MTQKHFRTLRILSAGTLVAVIAALAVISAGVACGWSASLYSSPLLLVLWFLLVGSAAAVIYVRRLWCRPAVFLLHISFVLILAGALMTHFTGTDSLIHLRVGGSTDTDAGTSTHLPHVTLSSFDIVTYAGTDTPRDYVCTLQDHSGTKTTASLNRPGNIAGYAFLPASYDEDGAGVTLSVSHDPVGLPLTYSGYFLLAVAFVAYFFGKGSQWRAALRRIAVVGTFVAIATDSFAALSPEAAMAFNTLAVYHNDRICPVSVLAHDFTATLTAGASSWEDFDAEEVFEGYIFDFGNWKNRAVIKVSDKDLRRLLTCDRYASYNQYFEAVTSGRLDTNDPATNARFRTDIARFEAINMAVSGELLKMFPVADSVGRIKWYAPTDRLPQTMDEDKWMFVRKVLGMLNEQILRNDTRSQTAIIDAIARYQQRETSSAIPSPTRLALERKYAALAAGHAPAIIAVVIGMALYLLVLFGKGASRRIRCASIVAASVLWIWLSVMIALRWIVCGHVPMANGYETMQFLAWCIVSMTLILHRIHIITPLGILAAGVAMIVSGMSGAGASVTGLMAVLDSPLLSIHVAMMMAAYALFMLMALTAVTGILRRKDTDRLVDIVRVMLYPALALLTLGIFVGAIWANVSWGRYWGWDPKEVWALITMLVYTLPAHTSIRPTRSSLIPALSHSRNFLIYIAAAFVCVLITYFGVNYLLGGLHAYA